MIVKRVLVLVLAMFAFVSADFTERLPLPAAAADSIPWFAARDGNGKPFTKNNLLKIAEGYDRVALVYFATWCTPCREGLKAIKDNGPYLEEKKVKVVLVNVGEKESEVVTAFVKKLGLQDFTLIRDNYKRLSEGFGFVKEGEDMALPRTLVLDGNLKPLMFLGKEGQNFIQVLGA